VGGVFGHSGNAKLYYDGANVVAEIGATTATFASAITAINNTAFEYESGMLYASVNGVRGTGVASAAPAWGAYWHVMNDDTGANQFESGAFCSRVTPIELIP